MVEVWLQHDVSFNRSKITGRESGIDDCDKKSKKENGVSVCRGPSDGISGDMRTGRVEESHWT